MDNGKINYQRILLLAGALSLLIYYLFQWVQMISDPILRTSLDFVAFYSAGRIAKGYGGTHVYDVYLQHLAEEQTVGFQLADEQVLLYNHMPYLIPLLRILVNENYVASFIRWVLLLLVFYIIGFYALKNCFPGGYRFVEHQSFMLGAITFFPCFVSLFLGQDTAILFLGVVLLSFSVSRQKYWIGGIGLALITVRPHIALLLVLPFFIFQRNIFSRFLVVASIFGILSIFILGFSGVKDFIDIILVSAGGKWYGLNISTMINFNGFMARNIPFLGAKAAREIGWIVYLGGIPGLCLLAIRAKRIDIHVLGRMILICVFIVPHLHFHDLALLLFPLLSVYLGNEVSSFYSRLQKVLHPMIVSFLFLFGLFRETFFPSLAILTLFVFLFRKRDGLLYLPSEN